MNTLVHGDCLDVMALCLADNSVDSIVTDPPYGLSFMGRDWDHGVPGKHFWEEALRVAKPGAFLVAFGGTRTFHRLACAIEDAGWELRDGIFNMHEGEAALLRDCPWLLAWIYGQGMPKSKNGPWGGSNLKPAIEPIVLARKPLIGTMTENFERFGTGGLNIDGCRIGTVDDLNGGAYNENGNRTVSPSLSPTGLNVPGRTTGKDFVQPIGRWPANLAHDGSDEVLACFPDAVGQIADASTSSSRKRQNVYGAMKRGNEKSANDPNEGSVGFKMRPGARRGDAGSAARFFKQCEMTDEDWICSNLLLAPIADNSFSLQNEHVASALCHAACVALPEGTQCVVLKAPFTSVTASELRRICETLIATILVSGCEFWLGQQPKKPFQNPNLAKSAVTREQTGTTTITVSHWKSDGSAEPAIFSITAMNSEAGARDCERFMYCPKASRKDRNEGCEHMEAKPLLWSSGTQSPGTFQAEGTRRASENHHATVKPTELMRWLCRLVTPAGGTILDPFAGSGSTGKAAKLEGFDCIMIEKEESYIPIIRARGL